MQVLLYNAANGELIESLRGHKDTVTSLDYSFDGEKFASGGVFSSNATLFLIVRRR